ncbi:uncharacterized protein METZ01_LOCUS435250 [marine metagenome]|uniref:Uncharacterized protein n=1 Tax=marine metagenome TaxID=408172 RepID=A0A382YGG6_9ZZZZ
MKAAIELDIFQEMKLEENTGEIVMRPMAEMMDAPLDFIDEEDEPKWTPLFQVLTETIIDPFIVPASTEVPNEKEYHMMVAVSEDLFRVANDFARKVEGLHTIDPKEYQERMSRFEQGMLWPEEDTKL